MADYAVETGTTRIKANRKPAWLFRGPYATQLNKIGISFESDTKSDLRIPTVKNAL